MSLRVIVCFLQHQVRILILHKTQLQASILSIHLSTPWLLHLFLTVRMERIFQIWRVERWKTHKTISKRKDCFWIKKMLFLLCSWEQPDPSPSWENPRVLHQQQRRKWVHHHLSYSRDPEFNNSCLTEALFSSCPAPAVLRRHPAPTKVRRVVWVGRPVAAQEIPRCCQVQEQGNGWKPGGWGVLTRKQTLTPTPFLSNVSSRVFELKLHGQVSCLNECFHFTWPDGWRLQLTPSCVSPPAARSQSL